MPYIEIKPTAKIDRRGPNDEGDPSQPVERENLISRDKKLVKPLGTSRFHKQLSTDVYSELINNGGFETWPTLTWDSYVKLMMHCDGTDGATTFTDEIGKTVTNTADQYDAYTKACSHFDGANTATAYTDPIAGAYTFVNHAKLSTAQYKFTTGASLLLDGTDDYVTLPDSDSWYFGTGDFTVDCWVMFNAITAPGNFQGIICQYQNATNTWEVGFNCSTKKLEIYFTVGGVDKAFYQMTSGWSSVTTGVWYHLVFERATTTAKIFIDGVSQPLTEITAFGTNDVGDLAGLLHVGDNGLGDYFNGYIDEVKISNGIARHTSDFTSPVQPYGRVYLSTAQKEFGTASGVFDGSGSYLSLADSADWNFGTGNFTIDGWVRFTTIGAIQVICGQYEDATNYWFVEIDAANKLQLKFVDGTTKGDYIMSSAWSGLAVDTWYHVAFVRSTTTAKIFIGGVSQTLTETTAFSTNDVGDIVSALFIGEQNSVGYFQGFIDELRISKGVARWTADFSVPTSAYAAISGTPSNWSLSGGISERESTIVKADTYSAKLSRLGTNCYYYEDVSLALDMAHWKGKTLTYSAYVYATAASRARIGINDGVTITYSSYHTGDSTWQLLTVTATIGATATQVYCLAQVDTGDTSAYFDTATAIEATTLNLLSDICTWMARYTTVETGQISPKTFAYTQDGVLWVYSDVGVATQIKSGLNIDAYPKSWVFKTQTQSKLYLVDGQKLYRYDGNNDNDFQDVGVKNSDDTDIMPIDVIEHRDRLFLMTNTTILVSANLDPDNFSSATDSIELIVGSGKGKNMAFGKIEDKLYIFNTEGIFILYGDLISAVATTFEVRILEERRCIAGRSVAKVEKALMFLADDYNVWSWDGSSSQKMSHSEKLEDYVNTYRLPLDKAVATYYNNFYMLSFVEKGQSNNNLEIWWDAFENKIDFVRGRNISCYMQTDPNIEQKFMLTGRSDVNTVMLADNTFNFDNQPIAVRLRTRDVTPQANRNVRFTGFYPKIAPTGNRNLLFQYMLDGILSNDTTIQFTQNLRGVTRGLGQIQIGNQNVFMDRIKPKILYSRGKSIAFVLIDSTFDMNFELRSIGVEYVDKFEKKTKKVGA